VEGLDQCINADLSYEVEQPDKDADYEDASGDDQDVLSNLLGGGPYDLLQLAAKLAEIATDGAGGSFEPIFLFNFCHCGISLLSLVVNGMLLAESAILLHLKTIGVILLVFHSVVVSLLALRASQSDFYAHYGTSLKIASLYHSGYQKI
jgi:hypothetical protein